MRIKYLLPLLALPLVGAVCAQAQSGSISFQQGVANAFSGGNPYAGTSDLTLNSVSADLNYGAATGVSFSSSRYTGLLRFDLSSFTDTVSAVENVKLRVAIRNVEATVGEEFKISLYALDAANADWQQGNKNGTAATAGESAYGFKLKGAGEQPDTPWLGGEGFSAADYGSTLVASYDYTSAAAGTTFIDIVLPGSIVANWINNPSANAGLVIMSDSATAFSFYSSEYNTASIRPELSFDYTFGPPPIPEPATTALVSGFIVFVAVGYLRRGKGGLGHTV